MKTLVVGQVTHDLYDRGIVAGGCAYYGAQVHRRMSGPTHLVTVVGDDFACQPAVEDIDTTICRAGRTTVFANYYPDKGPRQQLLMASAPPVEPAMAPPKWLAADLVHLAPVFGDVDLGAWLAAVGDGLVAINIQGWLKFRGPIVDANRLERWQRRGAKGKAYQVVHRPWEVSADKLAGVDVACLSEEDLIGQPGLLARLRQVVPVVAVTMGRRGSRLYLDGEPEAMVGIFETEAVDPTGAGDTYAAAFCHRLAAGDDPIAAARMGAAAASVVVEGQGPQALARLEQMNARARQVAVTPC